MFSSSPEWKLAKRPDTRAHNGGLHGGYRTVHNDRSISFDGDRYVSNELNYYLRQKVWIEYADGNMHNLVNVLDRPHGRIICTIDNR